MYINKYKDKTALKTTQNRTKEVKVNGFESGGR
jgi:hypothetical protein